MLPLFSRACRRPSRTAILDGHTGRRIVLATNVAETSLTVPGIRYVIDAGTARVKRYSFRSKVEAVAGGAHQPGGGQPARRAVAAAWPTVSAFACTTRPTSTGRDRFTDPEILRSSLAGVILRMKALGLGDVVNFPFLEAPSGRAIADGYQLLAELGRG